MRKILFFTVLIFSCVNIRANETKIWKINSKEEILRGRFNGISVNENGVITLAPELRKVFDTEQPYVWSTASDPGGNLYLGTGSEGKLFKIDRNGNAKLIADFPELNVTAIAISKNGDVFAATSPDGKVYKISADGKSEVYFEPKQKYIWALALLPDGSLAVGTGEKANIYLVRQPKSDPEKSIFFKTNVSHIMCLAVDGNGNLYAGTDPEGLLIKISPQGKPFALLDSELREIHDISISSDGSIYALALSDSIANAPKTQSPEPEKPQEKPIPTPETTLSQEKPTKSRYDFNNTKSAIYKISTDGNSVVIWNSNLSAFSIIATSNGVLVGTSDKGRIYLVNKTAEESLVLETGEGQISKLLSIENKIFALSSNQAKVFAFSENQKVAEGKYESHVLDAKGVASWGRIWWQSSGNVTIQTRSGNTEKPDDTWSEWSTVTGNYSAQIQSPKARFFQLRAILRATATLNEIYVSYLTSNIAPEILSIEVLPPNVGLATNPLPPIDPNIESSGLDPQTFGIQIQAVPPRRIYQRGARAFQWTAEDRNGDKLTYAIYYKEINDSEFKLLAKDITENFYTIDGLSLPDGRYLFKIIASDSASNPIDQSLTAERVTEVIEIDNSPPVIKEISRQAIGNKVRLIFEATDSSYLTKAEYSVNGGKWEKIYPEDGITDSPKERYVIELPLETSETIVTLRVFDSNGNIGNAKASLRR